MPASDANNSSRSRTITWEDPLANLQSAAGMTGLEYMRELASSRRRPSRF